MSAGGQEHRRRGRIVPASRHCRTRFRHHRRSSTNAWHPGHHQPTATACRFRSRPPARTYARNRCCCLPRPDPEAVRQPCGQGGLVHIRSDPCGGSMINIAYRLHRPCHAPHPTGTKPAAFTRRMVPISCDQPSVRRLMGTQEHPVPFRCQVRYLQEKIGPD